MNIYDFDKTIYDGDSSIDFFKYSLKKHKKLFFQLPKIAFAGFLYLIKIKEKEYFKSIFFSFITKIDNLEKEVNDFWKQSEFKIKKFYKKNKKTTDIIVSASPEFLLNPISKKLNFNLIATKVDTKTGKLIGKNCYGKEKVKRLKEKNITSCTSFYSDSLSDTPLSKIAKTAYIVKGNELIPWNEYKETNIKKTFLTRDFITFLFIGGINVINGVLIAWIYSLFIKDAVLAYILGFFTSLTISYILNSLLNFKEKLNITKYIKFFISNIPNFIIQVLSVIIFYNILLLPKIISYLISSVIAVPITFILIKIFVYKK